MNTVIPCRFAIASPADKCLVHFFALLAIRSSCRRRRVREDVTARLHGRSSRISEPTPCVPMQRRIPRSLMLSLRVEHAVMHMHRIAPTYRLLERSNAAMAAISR